MRPGAENEQSTQATVALAADPAGAQLVAARREPRSEPRPGREVASRAELTAVADRRYDGVRAEWANPRQGEEAPRRLIVMGTLDDACFKRARLALERMPLAGQNLEGPQQHLRGGAGGGGPDPPE